VAARAGVVGLVVVEAGEVEEVGEAEEVAVAYLRRVPSMLLSGSHLPRNPQ